MTIADPETSNESERFDALAAAAETNESNVLPSLIADDEVESEPETDTDIGLITAQDLAHLTGDGGPSVNSWDSAKPPPPPAPTEAEDGIDAPVSKAVVFPLVAIAVAAVAFVAFSIVTASPSVRPDAVALIDQTTTSVVATTTTEPFSTEPGTVGVDLAEQAASLCAGEQFGIARAAEPSLATYNDLLVATRDGRDAWSAPADHMTLLSPVPALIGCLSTADSGEIDRCPNNDVIISRRSVTWSYRVLRSSDGTELGRDSGTATDTRSCEELVAEADDTDTASWSTLPQDVLDQVAAEYTSAPHPRVACPTSSEGDRVIADPIPFEQGASIHAMFDGITDEEVTPPSGWRATDARPVEVLLCLENLTTGSATLTAEESEADVAASPPADDTCEATTRVHAMHRDGRFIGSWDYAPTACPPAGEAVTPPHSWWVSTVGPPLGYELEEAETEGS